MLFTKAQRWASASLYLKNTFCRGAGQALSALNKRYLVDWTIWFQLASLAAAQAFKASSFFLVTPMLQIPSTFFPRNPVALGQECSRLLRFGKRERWRYDLASLPPSLLKSFAGNSWMPQLWSIQRPKLFSFRNDLFIFFVGSTVASFRFSVPICVAAFLSVLAHWQP